MHGYKSVSISKPKKIPPDRFRRKRFDAGSFQNRKPSITGDAVRPENINKRMKAEIEKPHEEHHERHKGPQ